jgi:hypothetical protein
LGSFGGVTGFSSGKRPAAQIYTYKIEMLKNQAYNVEQRIAEQEQQMGSQEEDVQLATAAA